MDSDSDSKEVVDSDSDSKEVVDSDSDSKETQLAACARKAAQDGIAGDHLASRPVTTQEDGV